MLTCIVSYDALLMIKQTSGPALKFLYPCFPGPDKANTNIISFENSVPLGQCETGRVICKPTYPKKQNKLKK